jgi:hypothetical protein
VRHHRLLDLVVGQAARHLMREGIVAELSRGTLRRILHAGGV